jgi:hypothetical protein
MSTWPRDQLERIGASEELQLASRPDRSLRPYVTMWAVRAGRNSRTWARLSMPPLFTGGGDQ